MTANTGTVSLIAVCGAKYSGKDTIAAYFVQKHGHSNKKISSQLKAALKVLFEFTDDQLETAAKETVDERYDASPRALLQFFGTEVMQYKIQEVMPGAGRKFWIKRFIAENLKQKKDKIVVSDLRFVHEYEELAKYKPLIIRVERDGGRAKDNHPSETEYLDVPADIVIKNNGTIEELWAELDHLFDN
jgi:hypothetical protein